MAEERLGPEVRDADQRKGSTDFASLGRRVLEVESNSVLIATWWVQGIVGAVFGGGSRGWW